ncbi:MAG TPA: stage V sporulation protein G [Planctomycetes bacterium]|nr:stage V sporulation protein G [Planctomycetota bacterium]
MEITNVRVRLADGVNERLCGYCTMTIDNEFVVRDLRIIIGDKGLFVAMPSRKGQRRCPRCGVKNSYQAKFCSECGNRLRMRLKPGPAEQSRLHVDIAHPITPECRRKIQDCVISAYEKEKTRASAEGYVPPPSDDEIPSEYFEEHTELERG